jgi:hypothetical protein
MRGSELRRVQRKKKNEKHLEEDKNLNGIVSIEGERESAGERGGGPSLRSSASVIRSPHHAQERREERRIQSVLMNPPETARKNFS